MRRRRDRPYGPTPYDEALLDTDVPADYPPCTVCGLRHRWTGQRDPCYVVSVRQSQASAERSMTR